MIRLRVVARSGEIRGCRFCSALEILRDYEQESQAASVEVHVGR
jgi:hypothetical protein